MEGTMLANGGLVLTSIGILVGLYRFGYGIYLKTMDPSKRTWSFYFYSTPEILWTLFVTFCIVIPLILFIYPLIMGVIPLWGLASLAIAIYRLLRFIVSHFYTVNRIKEGWEADPIGRITLRWIVLSIIWLLPEAYLLYAYIQLL